MNRNEKIANWIELKPVGKPKGSAWISALGWWRWVPKEGQDEMSGLMDMEWTPAKDPGEDIAAAMELVYKIREKKHWSVRMLSNDGLDAGPEWNVTIYRDWSPVADCEGEELAEAICNAFEKHIDWERDHETPARS